MSAWTDERIIAEAEAWAASWYVVLDANKLRVLRGEMIEMLRGAVNDEGAYWVNHFADQATALEQAAPVSAMDAPDGPGWWAFEGYFDFGEDDTDPADIQRCLCEVKEVMRWAFIANGTAHLIEHMIGTWTRVYLPWERPATAAGEEE